MCIYNIVDFGAVADGIAVDSLNRIKKHNSVKGSCKRNGA